jgi:hypothetical protein
MFKGWKLAEWASMTVVAVVVFWLLYHVGGMS